MKPLSSLFSLALLLVVLPTCAAEEKKGHTFDSKGVTIHYSVAGKGDPVVLIHGLYSSAGINWDLPGTTKALAEKYQVIALDLRGHGASGKPEKEEDYGVEMAEDVIRLLDHLKIKKAHVVGYSLGGMITMKLLTKHPDRFDAAVLGGMGWFKEGSPLEKFWDGIPAKEGGGMGTPNACLRAVGKLSINEDDLKAIKVPVAVLVGDKDPCLKLYVEPLEKVRKDWTVVKIEKAGHLTCILKPQFKEEVEKQLGLLTAKKDAEK